MPLISKFLLPKSYVGTTYCCSNLAFGSEVDQGSRYSNLAWRRRGGKRGSNFICELVRDIIDRMPSSVRCLVESCVFFSSLFLLVRKLDTLNDHIQWVALVSNRSLKTSKFWWKVGSQIGFQKDVFQDIVTTYLEVLYSLSQFKIESTKSNLDLWLLAFLWLLPQIKK